MTLRKEHPGAALLFDILHFPRRASGIDRFDVAQLGGLMADRNRDPVVVRDILKLLARPVDQEIEPPTLVRITHDRRLGPTVRPYRRYVHDPVFVQDPKRRLLHLTLAPRAGLARLGKPARHPRSYVS